MLHGGWLCEDGGDFAGSCPVFVHAVWCVGQPSLLFHPPSTNTPQLPFLNWHSDMEPTKAGSALTANALRGQQLYIPTLLPAFAAWKQGINPSYERVKQAVDERLEGLVGDERVLMKVKAADIGLFAAGYGLLLLSVPCAA